MGQYHVVANLDKKEFLHPHHFGDGLKLMEFGNSCEGTMTGLAVLLAEQNGRGGGDLRSEHPVIGSWARDRIVIAGDYYEDDELFEGHGVYSLCSDKTVPESLRFTNITNAVIEAVVEGEASYGHRMSKLDPTLA